MGHSSIERLERFFWERLIDFERGLKDIRRGYPRMRRQLDTDSELARWRREVAD